MVVGIASRAGLVMPVTWWATTPDTTGGDVCAAGVLLNARWEDKAGLYISQIDHREQVSNAVVYLPQQISVGDYLAQGDHTSENPTDIIGAYKVQRFIVTPDLRNLNPQYKATL